ncbi:signal peptidase II [Demequina pelophila]|uniref:signal peptidase II n=1 Tax=Demequina pelophila TaxID=1638984 RepID=UPI000AAD7B4F|nr:signal peptidase II [Demequina pelophila]
MTWRPAFWLWAGGVIAVDLATKQWALSALEPYENHPLLGDLLGIQLVFNSGAAFSMGAGYTWVLTLVALAITAGIVFYGRRARTGPAVALFGIALGGAIGNLIDRLFRDPSFGQGHVVDMINYGHQFVGNVADIAIVGAAIAIVAGSLFGWHPLGETGDDAPVAAAGGSTVGSSDEVTDGDAEAERG